MGIQLWCDRQVTVRVQGPDGERTIDVGKPYARIGSHPQADVILEGPDVPKIGLYCHATERGIYGVHLSRSPSLAAANGFERSGMWLSNERSVVLGDHRIYATFTYGPPPQWQGLPRLDAKGSSAVPVPVVAVLVNDQRRAVYRAYRSLTVVGRDVPSALRLKSEFISTTHCVLYWHEGQLWFVDLLSSNGTEKRGRRREVDRLQLGKAIKVGDVWLGFAHTSNQPWSGPSDHAVASETIPPLHTTDLLVASVADSSGSTLASASSRLADDMPFLPFENEEDLSNRLTTDLPEALTEMQRQLEKQRIDWEEERSQQEQALHQQHAEIDRHFTEIQSWRSELDVRSGQLDDELSEMAAAHAELDRKRRDLAAATAQLERREHELEQQRDLLEQQLEDWSRRQTEEQAAQALLREQLDQQAAALAAAHQQLAEQQRTLQQRDQDALAGLDGARKEHESLLQQVQQQRAELAQTAQQLEQQRRDPCRTRGARCRVQGPLRVSETGRQGIR